VLEIVIVRTADHDDEIRACLVAPVVQLVRRTICMARQAIDFALSVACAVIFDEFRWRQVEPRRDITFVERQVRLIEIVLNVRLRR